jgi:hypothetical protein
MADQPLRRIRGLLSHLLPVARAESPSAGGDAQSGSAAVDELDQLIRRAEDIRREEEANPVVDTSSTVSGPLLKPFVPYLVVPTYVEQAQKSGARSREQRRQKVNILYDVATSRAQQPVHLDVSSDDPLTPKAFRIIRVVLLSAEARGAQDVHWDQHSARVLSVVFTTPLGITKRLVIKGPVVQSVIYYLGFHDLVSANKGMPGAVRDYSLKIKLRSHDFLHGTHHVYRVNCIRTNHELGFYHIVMRLLQG